MWSALEQVGGLVDHGPVALIGMNTRVEARDVPPTTVIEDIEFVQAQVQRFAEAQLASAWSRLAPTTARPPARRAEAVRSGPPPEPNVPNVPGPTRRRSRHRQDVVHPLTRNTTGMQAAAAQASS